MFSNAEREVFCRAVQSRDHRFDGRFYVGVKTTGIYCRPICPARPKPKNLEFFKTAQAAESKGYRPCLRCRPEVAPQSPIWIGTSATVKRAIHLIGEGFLFQSTEKDLALKLGVSERHLRRLFIAEIGVTAKQVSDSQRLNFACTLIVETGVPITEIAFHSGFNSIRRFNDAFKKKFSKKPSDLRKIKKRGKNKTENQKASITLRLRYRPPYDWESVLGFFRSHAAPGIEKVTEDTYQRLFLDEFNQKPALAVVSHLPDENSLKLEVFGSSTKSLFSLSRRIRRMFDLDSDPLLIAQAFSKSNLIKKIHSQYPGMRIPRGWDPFETAIATVLGQFVSVEQGRKLLGQLILELGSKTKHSFSSEFTHFFPSPEVLGDALLSQVKTTQVRKETIRQLSQKVCKNELDFSGSGELEKFKLSLSEVKGIGPWSLEYICLRALGETDAFPVKDLTIGRVLKKYPEINHEEYRPWRAYLTLYLWKMWQATT